MLASEVVRMDKKKTILVTGVAGFIGFIHRLDALEDADVAEVSTSELDEVIRLEDRYGREGTSAP